MYFSDDSDLYETTASQDERIAQKLQEEREEEKSIIVSTESERKEAFEKFFSEKSNELFNLPGLTFLKFTSTKIKFCFEPSKVVTHVRRGVKFYCSLKYYEKYSIWTIRRESFPVTYKWRIYNIFYTQHFFAVTDETVINAITRVYAQLKLWAREEEDFRQEKFLRYQNGEDVVLDSDDEQLFLTEVERNELHEKRKAVLKRMIPPPNAKTMVLPPERVRKKTKKMVPEKMTSETEDEEWLREIIPPKKKRKQLVVTDSD